MSRKSLTERFKEKYTADIKTGCWNWIASENTQGYGQINVDAKPVGAHRVSWVIHNGPIPDIVGTDHRGTCICHKCDNRLCVNPDHLFLGSHADNMKDKDNKGHTPKGDNHHWAKLSDNSVSQIRKYHIAGGCAQKWLAQVYKVNQSQISRIVNRERRL